MLLPVVFIILSIGLLYYGAEFVLESAEKVGKILGMSPLLVGMILVGFGTSLPEFFVGHIAALENQPGIAFGSLIGSNIANIFLILGITGLIAKLSTIGESLKEHLVVHLLLCMSLFFVLGQKELGLIASTPLIGILIIYLFFILKDMKRSKTQSQLVQKELVSGKDLMFLLFKLLVGFALLYAGGELLVKGGIGLGSNLGIDPYIVSSIFIAFGTSFPELVTALMAAFKKKDTDIIVGNIIGSNIFNCAFILGTLGIYNFEITTNFAIELYALLGGATLLVLLSLFQKSFYRLTGGLFLCVYIGVVFHWLNIKP
jgi:cation:H+ antiporter